MPRICSNGEVAPSGKDSWNGASACHDKETPEPSALKMVAPPGVELAAKTPAAPSFTGLALISSGGQLSGGASGESAGAPSEFAASSTLAPASLFPFAVELANDAGWIGNRPSRLINKSGVSA